MAITPEQLAASGSEDGHQAALFCWCALNFNRYPQLKWMHAIKNDNGHRRIAQGVRGGVVDIFLPVPIKYPYSMTTRYNGMYLEMKKPARRKEKNGGLSDKQIEFLDYANQAGYQTVVCYSWEEARDELIKYLKG
jgi:hypothetical protein